MKMLTFRKNLKAKIKTTKLFKVETSFILFPVKKHMKGRKKEQNGKE